MGWDLVCSKPLKPFIYIFLNEAKEEGRQKRAIQCGGGISGVARGRGGGGQLPPGAARRGAPKSCQRILKNLYKEKF